MIIIIAYIAFTLWAVGVFGNVSPNLNGSGWNLEYKWGVNVCTHTKIGEIIIIIIVIIILHVVFCLIMRFVLICKF